MIRFLAGMALCAVFAHAIPAFATPSAWPFAEERPVVLGYGSTYLRDAKEYAHSGIDIAGSEGDRVLACAGGTISFAGRVPSAGGGSVLAVTIELPDARKLTVLPLASLDVRAGETVECGSTLGMLAAVGDSSCEAAHVHVSLRRGELYEDPGALLLAPVALSVPEQSASADMAVGVVSPGVTDAEVPAGAGAGLSVAVAVRGAELANSGGVEAGASGEVVGARGVEVARSAGSLGVGSTVHEGVFIGEPAPTRSPNLGVTARPVGQTGLAAALCRSLAALAAAGSAICFSRFYESPKGRVRPGGHAVAAAVGR
ncbi:MAG: M23 family metallopeptidase [Actinomycetota bacterium]|nr:M23 family metallopeptidase [Actinomycetota bacterium]